jgi:hypothetical protein
VGAILAGIAGVTLAAGGAGLSAYGASKQKKDISKSRQTTMPKLPKAALRELYREVRGKTPERFLSPEQRTQLFAEMKSASDQALRGQQLQAGRRAGGDLSSPLAQRLMTNLGQGTGAETASEIAKVDVEDLLRGQQVKQARIGNLTQLLGMRAGQKTTGSTQQYTEDPGAKYAALGSAAQGLGGSVLGGIGGVPPGPGPSQVPGSEVNAAGLSGRMAQMSAAPPGGASSGPPPVRAPAAPPAAGQNYDPEAIRKLLASLGLLGAGGLPAQGSRPKGTAQLGTFL